MGYPWNWLEGGKVEIAMEGEPTVAFQLVPTEARKVARFQRQLSLALKVSKTLGKAAHSYETGAVVAYKNAAEKVRELILEWAKASQIQLDIACNVSAFFTPGSLDVIFGDDVDLLTEFSDQTIDKLLEAAAPKSQKKDSVPPTPPPSAESKVEDPPKADDARPEPDPAAPEGGIQTPAPRSSAEPKAE